MCLPIDLVKSQKHLMGRIRKFSIWEKYLWFWNSCRGSPDEAQSPRHKVIIMTLFSKAIPIRLNASHALCSEPTFLRETNLRQTMWGHAGVLQPRTNDHTQVGTNKISNGLAKSIGSNEFILCLWPEAALTMAGSVGWGSNFSSGHHLWTMSSSPTFG